MIHAKQFMAEINYSPESFKNRQYNKRTSGIGLSVLVNEGEEWERIEQAKLQIGLDVLPRTRTPGRRTSRNGASLQLTGIGS